MNLNTSMGNITRNRENKGLILSYFKEYLMKYGLLLKCILIQIIHTSFFIFKLTEWLFFLLQNNDIIYYNAKDDQNDVSNMFLFVSLPVISEN